MLEIPEDTKPTRYVVATNVAVITLAAPPVNSLGQAMRAGLQAELQRARKDAAVKAVVIIGAGRLFCGGADIHEFATGETAGPDLNLVCSDIETLGKPVVAAIHGVALGGGLELALACHNRIASPGARLGFPEVLLGVLPGAGGTQRLPRLVGVPRALDMILTGLPISTEAALECGLIDARAEGDLQVAAIDFARKAAAEIDLARVVSALPVSTEDVTPDYFAEARATALRKAPQAIAPDAIVNCVEFAASGSGFIEGLAFERKEFMRLMNSSQSKALRHLFFAEREAVKIPDLDGLPIRAITTVGIIGAGTMGTGIALNFLNVGIPVVLLEVEQSALDRGIAMVRKSYEASAAKGRINRAQMDERMTRLHGTVDYADVVACDLVVEAVFENMTIKRDVCAKLGQLCKPGAIIATNTSTLNVDALADASGRPADFVGMHFFSPANVMRLLEVVRGARTEQDVLATTMALARKIGKVAVVSSVCYGFIGNRMIESYLREMDFLLMEGATPLQIDQALESFGMAMGPCRVMDLTGVDVNAKVLLEREKEGALPAHPAYRAVCRKLAELGRNGQKTSLGYYRYDGRTAVPDSEFDSICADLAARHGITRRNHITHDEIRERCLYPLINEGFRILEEGIAYRSSDIDVVWTAGYGFPRLSGGPMYMANQVGLDQIHDRLLAYGAQTGDTYDFWTPAQMLVDLVQEGAGSGASSAPPGAAAI